MTNFPDEHIFRTRPEPKSLSATVNFMTPYASVASAIFGGLTFLSEKKQEKRLAEISKKLDLIRGDLRYVKNEIINKIEEVQLREAAGDLSAIGELLDEIALDQTGTILANVMSDSAKLKGRISQAINSSSIPLEMRASYASLFENLIAFRIMAISAYDSPPEELFSFVEDESLDLEYNKDRFRNYFDKVASQYLIESNFMFSEPYHDPDQLPNPVQIGGTPYVPRDKFVRIYVKVADYDQSKVPHYCRRLPRPGTIYNPGVIYGGFPVSHLESVVFSARELRLRAISRALMYTRNSFINDYGQENYDFRDEISRRLRKPFNYYLHSTNSPPELMTDYTGT